jgi:elongation factor Ts
MSITASQVKELRERTGAGMMDAKNALVEAGGDMEKAAELLRQKGIATAEKKSGRVAADGQVYAKIATDAKVGVLLEVNCETDFVAKGDAFQQFVKTIADHVADKAPSSVEDLMGQTIGGQNVKDYLTEQVAQIKENITIRRFVRYQVEGVGATHAYIHIGGKIGVLVQVATVNEATLGKPEFVQVMKDVAMQIASASPEFVSRGDVDQQVIDDETRVEMGKEDLQNKPEEIRKKIVAGRVDKLIAQKVLMEQAFVKDPGKTIEEYLQEQSKTLGDSLCVVRFTRYALGEGIEKQVSNFAEEVMAQVR